MSAHCEDDRNTDHDDIIDLIEERVRKAFWMGHAAGQKVGIAKAWDEGYMKGYEDAQRDDRGY